MPRPRASRLRLFLDTAEVSAWEEWLPTGLFHGVTTNPTLLQAAGIACTQANLAALTERACVAGAEEIQMQTWGGAEALVENGRALTAIDQRVVVKVPLTVDGVKAVKRLRAEGIRTTLTALYAPHQVLTAAAARADYAAPYFGRIGDTGRDALAETAAMRAIIAGLGSPMRLLVASIRSAADLASLAAVGVDTFTIGPQVAAELFADPDTAKAVQAFEDAAGS